MEELKQTKEELKDTPPEKQRAAITKLLKEWGVCPDTKTDSKEGMKKEVDKDPNSRPEKGGLCSGP